MTDKNASYKRRAHERQQLVSLFTEVLDRYGEAERELHRAVTTDLLRGRRSSETDLAPLRARVAEKRAALIEAYEAAL